MISVLFVKLLCAGFTGCAAFTVLFALTKLFFSKSYSLARYYALVFALTLTLLPISFDFEFQKNTPKDKQEVYTAVVSINDLTVQSHDNEEDNSFASEKKASEHLLKAAKLISAPWLFISVLLVCVRLCICFAFSARLKKSSHCVDSAIIPHDVKVMESPLTQSPLLVYGYVPTIYLPLGTASKHELESVLSHELCHIKRMDIIVRYIMLFAKCVHFYNPFVYLMCKEIEKECEISCDYVTVKGKSTAQRQKYVSDVLSLAGRSLTKNALSFGISADGKELERRFNVILKNKSISKRKKAVIISLCVICAAAVLFSAGVIAARVEKAFGDIKDNAAVSANEAKTKSTGTALEKSMDTSMDISTEPQQIINTPVTGLYTEKEQIDDSAFIDFSVNSGLVNDVTYSTSQDEPTLIAVKFTSPLENIEAYEVSRGYGDGHTGIDYKAPVGTPVYSVIDGVVTESGYSTADGNHITISDGKYTSIKYAHLDTANYLKGDSVSTGDALGTVGSTGMSTGPHLHFEVEINGKSINPAFTAEYTANNN